MSKRAHIRGDELLAAALRDLWRIPHDHAKQMTAKQIISLGHRDHYPIPKANGGPDDHWNIRWRLIKEHREKTAKVDIPAIAKGKRIRRREAEHQERMAERSPLQVAISDGMKRHWRKRRMQSAGFRKDITRGFDGKVRPRKTRRAR